MLVFVMWRLNGPQNKAGEIQQPSADTLFFICVGSVRVTNAHLELGRECLAFVIKIDLAQRRIMKAGEWLYSPIDEVIHLDLSLH